MRFLPPGSNVSPPWIRTKNIWMFDIYFLNSSIKFFAWFLILLFEKRKNIIEFFSHIPECRIFCKQPQKCQLSSYQFYTGARILIKDCLLIRRECVLPKTRAISISKNRSAGDFFSYLFSAARYLILSKIYFGYD